MRLSQRTTTKSAARDLRLLAKEQSWRTAWRARSLLSWTNTKQLPIRDTGEDAVVLFRKRLITDQELTPT